MGADDLGVSNIWTGRRICKLLTSDFLLVMMMPDFGLGLLENTVRSCLGGLQLGPLITLPICHGLDCNKAPGVRYVKEDLPDSLVGYVLISNLRHLYV